MKVFVCILRIIKYSKFKKLKMFPIRQSTKTLNESGLYKMKFHASAAETENGIKPFVQTNVHISIKIYISTVEISSLLYFIYIFLYLPVDFGSVYLPFTCISTFTLSYLLILTALRNCIWVHTYVEFRWEIVVQCCSPRKEDNHSWKAAESTAMNRNFQILNKTRTSPRIKRLWLHKFACCHNVAMFINAKCWVCAKSAVVSVALVGVQFAIEPNVGHSNCERLSN